MEVGRKKLPKKNVTFFFGHPLRGVVAVPLVRISGGWGDLKKDNRSGAYEEWKLFPSFACVRLECTGVYSFENLNFRPQPKKKNKKN